MPNANVTVEKTQNVKVSPAERALNFARATRQHWQMLPSVTVAPNTSNALIEIPKVRLTSKIRLLVSATLTATHASAMTYQRGTFAPWSLVKNIRVELNNGFAPFSVTGIGAYLYNLLRAEPETLVVGTGRTRTVQENAASSSGAANKVQFVIDLPFAFNDRDPYGLILTQNQETLLTVSVSVGDATDIVASGQTGYTFSLSNITITPLVESFTVPVVPEAIPDLSLLKIVHESVESLISGTNTIKLPPGLTYRKIVFLVTDGSGNPVSDSAITSDIELVLNQSDTPYKVSAPMLAAIDQEIYGYALPNGVYAFDFSYQGLPNYGGSRDYIDTERLTEFWLRFGLSTSGNVRIIREMIARLR